MYLVLVSPETILLNCVNSSKVFKVQSPYSICSDGWGLMKLNSVNIHQWHILNDENERCVHPEWNKKFFCTSTQVIEATVTVEMKIAKANESGFNLSLKITTFLLRKILSDRSIQKAS